jgi:hypothetical protein
MANNITNVGFGPEYEADANAIMRRRKLAEALSGEGMQPLQMPQTAPGGFTPHVSPFQGLAKMAQSYVGALGGRKADEEQKALGMQLQQRRGADMSALVNALGGRPASPGGLSEDASGNVTQADALPAQSPQQSIMQALPMMQDPQMQQAGLQALQHYQPPPPQPFTLKPGEQRYGPNGQLMATGPAEKPPSAEPFNLPPGHTRYGPGGQPIVTAPDKPPEQVAVSPVTIIKDGRAVVIDGRTGRELGLSPQDPKLTGAFNADTAQLQGTVSGLDRLATSANQLLQHPGLAGITGLRGKIPNVPGSDAADAQALLNTLRSQVGFGVLQDMRNASKTGGALGNVSDAEGKRLEANLAALENTQSLDQFKRSLNQILSYSDQAKDRMREAFNLKHGGQGGLPTRPGEAPQPAATPTPQRRSTDRKTVKWSDL